MHRVPFQRWGLLHLSQVFSRLNIRGSKADVAYSSLSTLSYRQFSQLSWPTTVPEYTIKTSAWQEEEVERIRNEIWEGKNIYRKSERDDGEQAQKKRKIDDGESPLPIYATHFSAEDIAAEQRRPKKKVAVMIGYSGTGYHGMQLSPKDKTIEGDLFAAFVAAGAISKANAADPKKSSLVRCARTDKGVHAAGNVISLKLHIDEPDIVQKINEHLSPQIRVWGYEVVTKGFSCYQLCDSRMYEYLIPTHCFLPPHPSTYLGRQTVQLAKEHGDTEIYMERQKEVLNFWQDIDEREIKPILEKVPDDIRRLVQRALYIEDREKAASVEGSQQQVEGASGPQPQSALTVADNVPATEAQDLPTDSADQSESPEVEKAKLTAEQKETIQQSIKAIKAAYLHAKRSYRIPESRLQRVQDALDKYVGTRNFHNYTIQKTFADPSSKRVMKSFIANKKPIIINGTEWVSLKVHGQSFMMHQIRKMVAMVCLIVRCGGDPKIIEESYGPAKLSIPKAPGLGLLLEHPNFDTYNRKTAVEFGKEKIDFEKYKKEMEEFKQREIYDRIFREEEETNTFGTFFNHIDHYPAKTFLYLTSGGIAASQEDAPTAFGNAMATGEALVGIDSESEANASDEEAG